MNETRDLISPREPTRILLIEDEPKLRESLAEGLRLENWDVSTGATGAEAQTLIETERFDLLILDWMLPDHDGIEVLRRIRSRGFSVPVLIVTARHGHSDRRVAHESGAADYVTKPFAFDDLLSRCRALLQAGSSYGEPGRQLV
jgi:DNA-binding response OmpR family regulator